METSMKQRRTSSPPVARLGLLAVVALAAGCSSAATSPSSASPARSPAPAASAPAAPVFTSRQYGYTAVLPAGWTGAQATQQWDGTGAPGEEDSVVDLFHGPGGVEAWAYAASTKENLRAFAQTTSRAAAAAHPCPAVPQTDQAITIGGAPARLLSMHCPPGSGFLVETAVTMHHGTAFVFASQNPTGMTAGDRAAFRKFLAGIRLQQ
jgi:hypothetical protein